MQDNKQLHTILLEMLRKLFGKGLSSKMSPAEYCKDSKDVEDFFDEMRDESILKGDVVEAYMYESQRSTLESLRSQVEKGSDANKDTVLSASKIESNIMDRMNDLKVDDTIKDAFQDYNNHSSDTITAAKNNTANKLKEFLANNNIKSASNITAISNEGTNLVEDDFSKRPTTPAMNMGIAKEDYGNYESQDNDSEFNRRRKSKDKDKDSEHGYSPSF